MKSIKKSIFILGLLLALVLPVKAITIATGVFTNGVFTNFPGLPVTALPYQVKSILVANNTTNAQTIWIYDIATNILTNVVSAYTNVSSSLTNYQFIVTNYYGNITTNTNSVLIEATNAIAGVTNTILPRLIITTPANSSFVTPSSLNYQFYNGLWITNASTGSGVPLAVTLTFQ